jgi:hypothetical protein
MSLFQQPASEDFASQLSGSVWISPVHTKKEKRLKTFSLS